GCGLPLFNSGYHDDAAAVAARTVTIFRDAEAVIVPSGSCAWMVKHEYPGLLRGRAEAADAERLAARTWEFSQFLVRRLGRTTFESDVEGPLAYHDSCHLLRGLHEGATPRTLLNNLSGAAVVPLPGSDECCGFGGHVHFATTAEEAREIVLDIARRTGARMAVKSKSMATEEIHLNDALQAIGVTPVETDLGEYIIQLAHERPSHIIAPAIHKTKGQVAELFSRELRRPGLPADPEVLTKIAREELREKFLTADLGITG